MRKPSFPTPAAMAWLLAMLLPVVLPAGTAQAGEIVIKTRNVQATAKASWHQIGDDEKHGVGAYEMIGLTFHEDDEVATYVNEGTFDLNHGADSHRGYVLRTYADGSTTTASYAGTGQYSDDGGTWEGTVSYISGTGRFAGIEGTGTYKGTRFANGMSVTDWEATVTLPD